MSWLDRLLPRALANRDTARATVPATARATADATADATAGARGDTAGYVVIDTETTGLDTTRDRLLSIGAVAVDKSRIDPADSFYAVLHQDAPTRSEDILIHQVGTGEQAAGGDPSELLDAFSAWCDGRWAVAFHAGFDRRMLERACRERRAARLAVAGWIDLAVLAPLLFPERAPASSLDEWLAAFDIDASARHNALGDALSTAQLLLPVLARAGSLGLIAPAALARESDAAVSLRSMRG